MLTAIINSTHLERVKSSAANPLHLESIESFGSSRSLSTVSMALGSQATAHGKLLGIYSGFDPTRECGWVVLSARLRLLKPLPQNRPIKVETWVASLDGGKLIREYRISENRKPIVEASHAFVLFDRIKRRIVIPPLKDRERFRGKDPTFSFDLEISRRTVRPRFSSDDQIADCVVTRSDIDQNHHLNNSVYLRWAEPQLEINGFSAHANPGFRAFEFGIEFLSEVALDEKVQVRTKRQENTTYFLSSNSNTGLLAVSKATLLSNPRG
jgi:acyl-ACP thioesterase